MEIIGRLTADAKVNTLKDERQVVNFGIAMNDFYRPKNTEQGKKITTYVQCAYWINSNIAERLTKGTMVELFGRIGVNAYSGMNGEAKATLTFHVNNIKIHGTTKLINTSPTADTDNTETTNNVEPKDDLPF
jgi:single-strand DNA-binding protein